MRSGVRMPMHLVAGRTGACGRALGSAAHNDRLRIIAHIDGGAMQVDALNARIRAQHPAVPQ